MKASTILRRAKKRMQQMPNDTSPFICDNIWHVTKYNVGGDKDEERITKFITKLLGGRFSLVEWLIDKGHIQVGFLNWSYDNKHYMGNIDRAKLQATRMAWLDYLIAHYKAKGD
jgi:hypothetical protein